MTRGGKREGAGRPVNKEKTVCYHRRIKPEWVEILDKVLEELKGKEKMILTKTGYGTEFIEIAEENLTELTHDFYLYFNNEKFTLCKIGKVDKLIYHQDFDSLEDLKKSNFPLTDWRLWKDKIIEAIDNLN